MTVRAPINIGNMQAVVEDARSVLRVSCFDAPSFDDYKINFQRLIIDLRSAAQNLPPSYRDKVATPFINYLVHQLGEWGFYQAFSGEPRDAIGARVQSLVPDITMAILVHGQTEYQRDPSAAFEELLAGLYDGLFPKEERAKPSKEILPPLVSWANSEASPYTIAVDATSELGVRASVICLPPTSARGALVSWISLGHEVAAHDFCHAYPDLLLEMKKKVEAAVTEHFHLPELGRYWANCVAEGFADVIGMLNIGPSAALGLIALLRSMSEDGRLRMIASLQDPHPIDGLRGCMGAKLVSELAFSGASTWAHTIYAETSKDLAGRAYQLIDESKRQEVPFPTDTATAVQSAYFVASFMANVKLEALGGVCLKERKNWSDEDQETANALERDLARDVPLPGAEPKKNFSANHLVAGAIQGIFKPEAVPAVFQQRVISYLAQMNRKNPLWAGECRPSRLPELVWGRAQRVASAWRKMGFQS